MRDLVTTIFEVVGLLLISTAVGVYLFGIDPALGLLGAGVGLLMESAAVVALDHRRSGDDS